MYASQREFLGNWIRPQNAKIADHCDRPSAGQSQAFPMIAAETVADRGCEVQLADECLGGLTEDDQDFTG